MINYFKLYTSIISHRSVIRLEKKWGVNNGLGLYIRFICNLINMPEHILSEVDRDAMADLCHISLTDLNRFIDDCLDIGLLIDTGDGVGSERLIENLNDYYRKCERNRENVKSRWSKVAAKKQEKEQKKAQRKKQDAVKPVENIMDGLSDNAKVIYQYILDNRISERLTIRLSANELNALCSEYDVPFVRVIMDCLYYYYDSKKTTKKVPYTDVMRAIKKWVIDAASKIMLPLPSNEYKRYGEKNNVLLKQYEYDSLLDLCVNISELEQYITAYSERKRKNENYSSKQDANNLVDFIQREKKYNGR